MLEWTSHRLTGKRPVMGNNRSFGRNCRDVLRTMETGLFSTKIDPCLRSALTGYIETKRQYLKSVVLLSRTEEVYWRDEGRK